MWLMQYTVTLPADYDLTLLRARVRHRGRNFDALPGLGLKAFLLAEPARPGAAAALYAPFYVWPAADGLLNFLTGELFAAVASTFGRPNVQTWAALAYGCREGPTLPRLASREIERVNPGEDLAAVGRRERERHAQLLTHPGVLASAAGLDPSTWEVVRFTLWHTPPASPPEGQWYEVLHLSAPLWAGA